MTALFQKSMVCPVLIDRANDLATFQALIDQAKGGCGQVVLLSGEAGIGKTRLVAEVKIEALAHDFQQVQGSCFPSDDAIPYAPLLDLLRSFLTSHSSALPASEVRQVAQAFLPLLPDVGNLLSDIPSASPVPSFDPEQEKRRRFETLAHFLTGQTIAHPVLLVVEDLHWSDETSLEFLHFLARRCPAHRLLLLLTYRSDEVRPGLRHFLAQLDRERLAQEVSLARLRREGVEAMLRAIFALPHTTRLELLDPIYTLTDGNPFFVEEILTSLIASGEIFYANGRWERKPLSELHIPRSVQDAVQQRTDQLSEPTRQVLTLAAVTGRRFDFALLQELTQLDEQHLLSLIKEMIAAQVVVEESAEQFAFRHALTRQAIYADLLVRERKALHRRIAGSMTCGSTWTRPMAGSRLCSSRMAKAWFRETSRGSAKPTRWRWTRTSGCMLHWKSAVPWCASRKRCARRSATIRPITTGLPRPNPPSITMNTGHRTRAASVL